MSQKVTIRILFLLQVFIVNCDVTIAATNSSSGQSITFNTPTADTSKHIRMEFSLTIGLTFNENRASIALCGTHAAGDSLMTNNNTPGFLIQSYCSESSGCNPGNTNGILPEHASGKFR